MLSIFSSIHMAKWSDQLEHLLCSVVVYIRALYINAGVKYTGPHTVYIRNDNVTHVLVADVYRSGQISASVDLRIGLVGIVAPLRAVGQTSFYCKLQPAANSIMVYPPRNVPDLLELPSQPGKGYLLSSVFTLPVHNLQSNTLTVDFGIVEKPLGQEGEFFIRQAGGPLDVTSSSGGGGGGGGGRGGGGGSHARGEISIAPGQTMMLSLELVQMQVGAEHSPVFFSCRKQRVFGVVVTPSRGAQMKVNLEFQCRRQDQSFLVSYVDHDFSISQAAVVFPTEWHSPDHDGIDFGGVTWWRNYGWRQ